MNTTEVKELVRNWYGSVAAGSKSCCGSDATPQRCLLRYGLFRGGACRPAGGRRSRAWLRQPARARGYAPGRGGCRSGQRRGDRLLPGGPASRADRPRDRR